MAGNGSRCHSCGATGPRSFYEADDLPVHSVLLMRSREEARGYPRRDLRLDLCGECGFVQNTLFDPTVHEYSPRCEETQGRSPTFDRFARELAGDLVERYGLTGGTVLEIGCGKGEFLAMLCESGVGRGVGYDPAYEPGRLGAVASERIEVVQDFYTGSHPGLEPDLVCCRHTLEHIQPTREFVRLVRRSIGSREETVVMFELPDVLRVLREGAFWDVYYEHCSYFSPGSLARLFRDCGFEILDLSRAFADQYLLIEARPGDGGPGPVFPIEESVETLAREVERFEERGAESIAGWEEELDALRRRGESAVLWGSGSKAVAFLTTLKAGPEIRAVVDINPRRWGWFMPGSGHPIVEPGALRRIRPAVVIVMNPIYVEEIREDLDAMDLDPRLLALGTRGGA